MLVLTRKLMERLYIGEDICVTVVRLEGGQVRLGIDAPRQVPVVRAELVPARAVEPSPPASPPPAPRVEGRPAPPAHLPLRSPRPSAPGIGIRRRGPSR